MWIVGVCNGTRRVTPPPRGEFGISLNVFCTIKIYLKN
jgi:hypothetical protein